MENILTTDGRVPAIYSASLVRVTRDENFTYTFKSGKARPSIIVPCTEGLLFRFEGGRKITVRRGDFLYIPTGLPYSATYLADGTRILVIHFDSDSPILPSSEGFSRFSDSTLCDSVIAVLDTDSQSPYLLVSKIYELLAHTIDTDGQIPKKYRQIEPALQEIRENFRESKPVAFYAELCSMSESNFRLLFRGYTGKSPIEYRNELRLAEARRLIDSGEYTVSEAAYLAGFGNMSFFYELYGRK